MCDEGVIFFFLPLTFPRIDSPSLGRHPPECATPCSRKLAFGKRLADVLIEHIGGFDLASLDERADYPMYLSSDLKRSNDQKNAGKLMYSYSNHAYQVSMCRRYFVLFRTYVDLFFLRTCTV